MYKYNKMSSSETESTASDMSQSDLSYEQELGEVCGEVDDGPLQPYQMLDFGENGKCLTSDIYGFHGWT
jgi:hypothetical protein